MDFHSEFEQSLIAFPSIEGIIFVDPDGESILFEAPILDPFSVKLAGAKLPIFMQSYRWFASDRQPSFMEIHYQNRYVLSIQLVQSYNITAIAKNVKDKGRLRAHIQELAVKFNAEIV